MSKNKPHWFSYQEMVYNMAFDLGISLDVLDNVVYELVEETWIPFCELSVERQPWFQTWLEMKKRIESSDFRFKNYT